PPTLPQKRVSWSLFLICAAPRRPSCNHPRPTSFNPACFALTPLALIRTSNRMDEPNSRHRGEQNRLIGEIDRAGKGWPLLTSTRNDARWNSWWHYDSSTAAVRTSKLRPESQ